MWNIPQEHVVRLRPAGHLRVAADTFDSYRLLNHDFSPADPRGRPGKHVICVYTDDANDRDDVLRVREELRLLGFTAKLPYKADRVTLEGRYEGDGPIASYYE